MMIRPCILWRLFAIPARGMRDADRDGRQGTEAAANGRAMSKDGDTADRHRP